MSWSKIKHAINSTLGTKNFKPLNEIVSEAFETIIGVQNSLKNALTTGNNNFYVSRAKNVDVDGFVGALEEYNTARSISGSYVGTGQYRENAETMFAEETVSLTFPFAPRLLVIQHYRTYWDSSAGNYGSLVTVHRTATLLQDVQAMQVVSTDGGISTIPVLISNEGKTVSWVLPIGWIDSSESHLNVSRETYYYTAIA